MAFQAVIPFLVGMMLLTGCTNTILTKYQDQQCVRNCDGVHGKPSMFEQPVIQTVQMFIGESGCWLVILGFYLVRLYRSRPALKPLVPNADDRALLAGWKLVLLALPACCDIAGTTLMNVGLLFVAASIYQMTRGALVLFVGLFSVVFLKRKLYLYHWLSLVIVVAGVAIVGLAGAIWSGQKHADAPVGDRVDLKAMAHVARELVAQATDEAVVLTVVGIFLIAGAQIFTATQFCLEEWILENYALEPLKVVAWEGLFGLLVTLFIQFILHLTVGVSKAGKYGYFDAAEGYRQVFSNRGIAISSLAIMVSIGGFNFFGLSVTRSISATSRSIIDTCRTLFIWIVSLGLGWESFKWLQVVGFALLVYGTFMFNDLVRPPLKALIPSKRDEQERGELLPEEPIEHIYSTPLLPSPISWEREHELTSPVVLPPSSRRARAAQEYKSYADMHILSFYYGDNEAMSLSERIQHVNDESEHDSEGSLFDEDCSYISSSDTDETTPTPTEPVRRPTACSEDSESPASPKDQGDRMKRFNARCCQVVQVPVRAKENQNRDSKAMLATILVGPGKARLVEISRPSSKQLSRSSDQSSTWAKPEAEGGPHASSAEPVETSAFSTDHTPSSNVVHAYALQPTLSPPDSRRLSASSARSTTAKAPPTYVSSRANLLTPPISLPPSPTETLSRQLRFRRLERTLDDITDAFDASTLLVLTSPTICALRSLLIPDSAYIQTLGKIFPEAQEIALSALAAWLILDLYLARVIKSGDCASGQLTQSPRTSAPSLRRDSHPLHDQPAATFAARHSGESLHTIPAKARSLLGIDTTATLADKAHEIELVERAVMMSENVDAVARTLMEVCRGGSWDEDVWKSLRCLVELMEDADTGEGTA
ncbi:hypothetical protein DV737_g5249, partial [Chaetothyriales sp. CBS 132003]